MRNVALLLFTGATPTVKADVRYGLKVTPFYFAARRGQDEAIQELVDKGCDLTIVNSAGLISEVLALQKDYLDFARKLRESTRSSGVTSPLTDIV